MAREIGSPVRGDGKIDAFVVVFNGADGYRMMGTTAFVESDYPGYHYPTFTQFKGVTHAPAGFLWQLDGCNKVIEMFIEDQSDVGDELCGWFVLKVGTPPFDPRDINPTIEWAERVFSKTIGLVEARGLAA